MSAEAAVVVIPGYYGTRLVEQTSGRVVWLSVQEVLFGTGSLAVPLPALGISNAVLVRSDGILEDIPVIPFMYSINAAYYLRYGAQQPEQAVETWTGASQVEAVVLAGVPYQGSMRTFRNMQYGRSIGFNKRLLTAEAVSSFPASYYLLPATGSDVLLSRSSERLEGLLYRVAACGVSHDVHRRSARRQCLTQRADHGLTPVGRDCLVSGHGLGPTMTIATS